MIQLSKLAMDRREPEAIFDKLVELGSPPDLVTLETGDYQFYVSNDECFEVLIERATWGNLLQKIKSGEIAAQIRRMVDGNSDNSIEKKIPILAVEGSINPNNDGTVSLSGGYRPIKTGWRLNSIRGFLLSAQLAGCYIIYTADRNDTAKTIVEIYEYFSKEDHEGLNRNYRTPVLTLKQPNVGEEILMGIPGVGLDTARALLGTFGSVEAVVGATEKELMTVEGVGKTKAKMIKGALTVKYA